MQKLLLISVIDQSAGVIKNPWKYQTSIKQIEPEKVGTSVSKEQGCWVNLTEGAK